MFAGGGIGNPITQVGWASLYIECYVSFAQAFQSQLLSLVTEGVFVKYPKLKVVFVDSGFTWIPPLMWRLDKNWKGTRREVPWIFFFQAEDGIRDIGVTGVQTCALPI